MQAAQFRYSPSSTDQRQCSKVNREEPLRLRAGSDIVTRLKDPLYASVADAVKRLITRRPRIRAVVAVSQNIVQSSIVTQEMIDLVVTGTMHSRGTGSRGALLMLTVTIMMTR